MDDVYYSTGQAARELGITQAKVRIVRDRGYRCNMHRWRTVADFKGDGRGIEARGRALGTATTA